MPKLARVVSLFAVAGLIAACEQAPVGVGPTAEPAGPDLSVTANDRVEFYLAIFVDCANGGAGELVAGFLRLHQVFSETYDANGGIHIRSHFQPMGGRLEGQATGDKYRATGVTREGFSIGGDGYPLTDTYVNNFRVIGPGRGNSFLVHETLHITINENGVTTADVVNSSIECR